MPFVDGLRFDVCGDCGAELFEVQKEWLPLNTPTNHHLSNNPVANEESLLSSQALRNWRLATRRKLSGN